MRTILIAGTSIAISAFAASCTLIAANYQPTAAELFLSLAAAAMSLAVIPLIVDTYEVMK